MDHGERLQDDAVAEEVSEHVFAESRRNIYHAAAER
jgi:hypothetical protein